MFMCILYIHSSSSLLEFQVDFKLGPHSPTLNEELRCRDGLHRHQMLLQGRNGRESHVLPYPEVFHRALVRKQECPMKINNCSGGGWATIQTYYFILNWVSTDAVKSIHLVPPIALLGLQASLV